MENLSEKERKFLNQFQEFLSKHGKRIDRKDLSEILVGVGILTYQESEDDDGEEFVEQILEEWIEEEEEEAEHVESFEKPLWTKSKK